MDARTLDQVDVVETPVKTAAPQSQITTAENPAPHKTASRMQVRLVEPRDRAALQNLLIQHHVVTEFRDQPFSPWKFNQNFDHVVSRTPRNVGMVAELVQENTGQTATRPRSRIIGAAWAGADSNMLSGGPLFVTVQLIAVDLESGPVGRAKAFLALVAGIRQWAASMNASHSFIHVTTGSNLAATDRLMKAAGARMVGGAYVV